MPFFKPANKKTGCVSLQVQKQLINHIVNNFIFRKRAYLFTSNGSITVEAAIAMAVFMMFILFMESFLMMINSTATIQRNVNNVALETAKDAFYLQMAKKISEKSDALKDIQQKINENIKDDNISEKIYEVMEQGVEITYLYKKLLSSIGEEAFDNKLCKISNFKMGKSSINNDIIDIVVEYKIDIPYINKKFALAQRGLVRGWTGEDISQDQELVYITKYGKVYHRDKDCSYLVVKISKVFYSQINELRNCYGEKYSKCLLCAKGVMSDMTGLFVTEDGNKYHKDLKCSGIKRNVISVDITQVGERMPCSRCGQGE